MKIIHIIVLLLFISFAKAQSNPFAKTTQNAVKEWYYVHQENLIWVENDRFFTCDCHGSHPNAGHFIINSNPNESE